MVGFDMDEIPPWLRKRPAAIKAVDDYVEDGMVVGLGTGNAANMAVDRIAELVKDGMRLTLVSSSNQTEEYARGLELEISDLNRVEHIDVTIDGADEIDPNLDLIKGLGGALLKEKILASMSDKEIIVADDFKRVGVLGAATPLPVEVCRFACERTAEKLRSMGSEPVLRMREGSPFITDEGHYIYDCKFGSIPDPRRLEGEIDTIPGVVECGLFVGLTYCALTYSDDTGVNEYRL